MRTPYHRRVPYFLAAAATMLSAGVATAFAQVCPAQSQLHASDGAPFSRFGQSLALHGDALAVGAPFADSPEPFSGAAYIFRDGGGGWLQEQVLSGTEEGDFFGTAVALREDVLVVGAPLFDLDPNDPNKANAGAAFVFRYDGNAWNQEQQLTLAGGSSETRFGHSASLSGDTLVIGAIGDTASGAAYVFVRDPNGTWGQQQKLLPDDAALGARFGDKVAVFGNNILVGAPLRDDPNDPNGMDHGAVYAYHYDGDDWLPEGRLTDVVPLAEDQFGISIALDGNTAVVGAFLEEDADETNTGAAYVFRGQDGAWSFEQKLEAWDELSFSWFGLSVALSGDTVLVGAPLRYDDALYGAGVAYAFRFDGAAWTADSRFGSGSPAENDQFGYAIALDDGVVAAGSRFDDDLGEDSGSVWLFESQYTEPMTLYVDDDAAGDPGPGDPSVSDPLEDGSPAHPFDAIQEAIDASACEQGVVLLLDGTYRGVGNRDLDYAGRALSVRSLNGPEACIIDCEGLGRGFTFHTGETSAAVVEGLTIRNGAEQYGGGIYCTRSSPTIRNCRVIQCSATRGGGMHNHISSPTLIDCLFEQNAATYVGGLSNHLDSSPLVMGCRFVGNTAAVHAGGLGNWIRCSPTIVNCVLDGNVAGMHGGGLNNWDACDPLVVNCTFVGNIAVGAGSGIYSTVSSNPVVLNCILWDDATDEIVEAGGAVVTVEYSNVLGGWSGTGNLSANPGFVDSAAGDYRLMSDSPAIDAGDNTAVPLDVVDLDADGDVLEALPWDAAHHARFIDHTMPDTGVPGNGHAAVIDMGAYETGCAGDADGDSDVDLSDLAVVLASFGDPGPGSSGDLDGDGDTDLSDLALVLANFGQSC